MASPFLLIGLFALVCAVSFAMLYTSGAYRQLFSRFAITSKIDDDSQQLSQAPSEWIENHEFWELGDTEEVAF